LRERTDGLSGFESKLCVVFLLRNLEEIVSEFRNKVCKSL